MLKFFIMFNMLLIGSSCLMFWLTVAPGHKIIGYIGIALIGGQYLWLSTENYIAKRKGKK